MALTWEYWCWRADESPDTRERVAAVSACSAAGQWAERFASYRGPMSGPVFVAVQALAQVSGFQVRPTCFRVVLGGGLFVGRPISLVADVLVAKL